MHTWKMFSSCVRKNLGVDSASSISTFKAASSSAFSMDCTTTCCTKQTVDLNTTYYNI